MQNVMTADRLASFARAAAAALLLTPALLPPQALAAAADAAADFAPHKVTALAVLAAGGAVAAAQAFMPQNAGSEVRPHLHAS